MLKYSEDNDELDEFKKKLKEKNQKISQKNNTEIIKNKRTGKRRR